MQFKHIPLYLEWAPVGVFGSEKQKPEQERVKSEHSEVKAEQPEVKTEQSEGEVVKQEPVEATSAETKAAGK